MDRTKYSTAKMILVVGDDDALCNLLESELLEEANAAVFAERATVILSKLSASGKTKATKRSLVEVAAILDRQVNALWRRASDAA